MSGGNGLQDRRELINFLPDDHVRHQIHGYSGKVIFSDKTITVVDCGDVKRVGCTDVFEKVKPDKNLTKKRIKSQRRKVLIY